MRLNTVQLSKINITDAFWKRYTDLVEDVIIPYQWDIMNDNIPGVESSHCLENFKIAAGQKKGQFYGAVFQDTDVAKWLQEVGYAVAEKENEEVVSAQMTQLMGLYRHNRKKDIWIPSLL